MRVANFDQATGPVEDRIRFSALILDIVGTMGGVERQPGIAATKSAVSGVGPGHRRARAIATKGLRPIGDGLRVLEKFERNMGLWQAQLLALIEDNVAAQAHQ